MWLGVCRECSELERYFLFRNFYISMVDERECEWDWLTANTIETERIRTRAPGSGDPLLKI